MSPEVIIIFGIAAIIRLLSLFVSIRNEKNLKQSGAIEFGRINTTALIISGTIFYVACFIEGYEKKVQFDFITVVGILLCTFSVFILFLIIQQLGRFWTFKLILARDHYLNESFLFRHFKHPNYFLNVIPELLSLVLICKAWLTFMILFPVHMIFLTTRIIQENKVMARVSKPVTQQELKETI